jgi:hypothetical protein
MRTAVGLIPLFSRVYTDECRHIYLIQGGYTEPVSIYSCWTALPLGQDGTFKLSVWSHSQVKSL